MRAHVHGAVLLCLGSLWLSCSPAAGPGDPRQEACRARCAFEGECDPTGLESRYGSEASCQADCVAESPLSGSTTDCDAAYGSWATCLGGLSCDDYGVWAAGSPCDASAFPCQTEARQVLVHCAQGCALPEGACTDGLDNDGDGLTDCDDPDCDTSADCLEIPEDCRNHVDDDGDGAVDCADPDCGADPGCAIETSCTDEVDDEGDGLVDCQDPDCIVEPTCAGQWTCAGIRVCANGCGDDMTCLAGCVLQGCGSAQWEFSNLFDCMRAYCRDDCLHQPGGAACAVCLEHECGDSVHACEVQHCPPTHELDCTNGLDDDGDNLTDCDDPDCDAEVACAGAWSCPDMISCYQRCGAGSACFAECRGKGCGNAQAAYDSLLLCGNQSCLADCAELGSPGCRTCLATHCAHQASTCLANTCAGTGGETDCSNGLDDDGDGAADCDDPDCEDAAACDGTWTCGDIVNCAQACTSDMACINACDDPGCGNHEAWNTLLSCLMSGCGSSCAMNAQSPACVDCLAASCPGQVAGCVTDLCQGAATESDCDDGVDNDGNGLTDCADPQCALPCPEADCGDGLDDDADGFADCTDPGCVAAPPCVEADCANGLDDDADGLTDCDDPDCWASAGCPERECWNFLDDDADGLTDCDDPDCTLSSTCPESDCNDGVDNDGDGATDCAEPGCQHLVSCIETDCANGVDDNGNGLIDCAEPSCAASCPESMCDDQFDDDYDGLVDCLDTDCATSLACAETECADGLDDNGDTRFDCYDLGCEARDGCGEVWCADGLDGDGDGATDCADSDCALHPACPASAPRSCSDLWICARFCGADYPCWRDCRPGPGHACAAAESALDDLLGCLVARCATACLASPFDPACDACLTAQCGVERSSCASHPPC